MGRRGVGEKEQPNGDGDIVMTDGQEAGSPHAPSVDHMSEAGSEASSTRQSKNKKHAAERQQAIQAQKLQKDLETAARNAQSVKEKADAKNKRAEKEEEQRLVAELAELEREFRRQFNSLRTTVLGQDRFCQRVWWLDGCGSADIVGPEGGVLYGTGRLYIQGPNYGELRRLLEEEEVDQGIIAERRISDEPEEGQLEEGEWAVIDSVDQVCNSLSTMYSS